MGDVVELIVEVEVVVDVVELEDEVEVLVSV